MRSVRSLSLSLAAYFLTVCDVVLLWSSMLLVIRAGNERENGKMNGGSAHRRGIADGALVV